MCLLYRISGCPHLESCNYYVYWRFNPGRLILSGLTRCLLQLINCAHMNLNALNCGQLHIVNKIAGPSGVLFRQVQLYAPKYLQLKLNV